MPEITIDKRELQFITGKVEQKKLIKIVGQRMIMARELNGLSQKKAAALLGYKNSSKLAKIENASDTCSVPFLKIHEASRVYKVSMDFLYGDSDYWERNPIEAQQKQVEQWLFHHYDNAKNEESKQLDNVFKKVADLEAVVSKSAKRAIENVKTLERMIVINPGCEDDLKLLAKLQRLLIETAEEAVGIDKALKKQRLSRCFNYPLTG